jgi:universal stress protein A
MLTIRKIVCSTDFSEPSYEAIKVAGAVARQFGAELYLVHVIEPIHTSSGPAHLLEGDAFPMSQYDTGMVDSVERELRELIEHHQLEDLQTRPLVRCGRPAEEIIDVAEQEKADLIVIASHGLGGWRRYLFGSVTDDVLYSAHCPVLVVKKTSASKAEKKEEEVCDSIH